MLPPRQRATSTQQTTSGEGEGDRRKNRLKRGSRGGRPLAFDADRYRQRNTVERAVSTLKQFRTVAIRYDKRAFMYLATVDVATIKIWLRDLTRDPQGTAVSPASLGDTRVVAGQGVRPLQVRL